MYTYIYRNNYLFVTKTASSNKIIDKIGLHINKYVIPAIAIKNNLFGSMIEFGFLIQKY